jgi:cobalt-zinc-cadmium efflux system protein
LPDSAKVRYTTACAGKFRICLSAASAAKILNPRERARLTAPSDIRLLPPESGTHTVALVTAPGEHAAELRRLRRALLLSIGVALTQALGVWYSSSLALLSDTGHVLTDVLALASAYLALKVLERPLRADTRLTYGLHRVEVLVALGSGLLFLGMCGWIAWEAVERLLQPRPVVVVPMLVTAAIGFVGNLVSALFLRHGASLSTRAAYLHVLGDLLSSVAVLSGGLSMLWSGAMWIDPVLSLVLTGLLLRSALRLLWEGVEVLLEAAPYRFLPSTVTAELGRVPGVAQVHDLHIWRISSREPALSAHLVLEPGADAAAVLAAAQQMLQERFGLHHTTLQLEPPGFAHHWGCADCRLRRMPSGKVTNS